MPAVTCAVSTATCQSGKPTATTTNPSAPLTARTALDVTGNADYSVTMLVLFPKRGRTGDRYSPGRCCTCGAPACDAFRARRAEARRRLAVVPRDRRERRLRRP